LEPVAFDWPSTALGEERRDSDDRTHGAGV